ncbi:hypothetical protein EVAR_80312_1 [Eumeta japonica]|uniref:Uncharacterized protein n=1 Tax=Eumeta variegata TaxID=151549 RepID=A0A4C1UB94_EUMVA|nr:hypothetical protein EVAR_80312_1 [Eumeta japonica]
MICIRRSASVGSFNTSDTLVDVTVCISLRMCLTGMKLQFHNKEKYRAANACGCAGGGPIRRGDNDTYRSRLALESPSGRTASDSCIELFMEWQILSRMGETAQEELFYSPLSICCGYNIYFEWTVFAAKYPGEFNIPFRLATSEESWSTMQEIVPRNKIAPTCRPQSRTTPRLCPSPHQ